MDASSSQFAWPFPLLLTLVATVPVMSAAGGRRHLADLPVTPPSAGTPQAPQGQDPAGGVSPLDVSTTNVAFLVVSLIVILAIFCYIRLKFCRDGEAWQGTGGRDNGGRARRSDNRGEAPRRADVAAAPPPAVENVELVVQAPVLECTFRMADGWEETTCSVCLSEMADGEKVRVLEECMHCFHTTCVEPWLREHATCPLCRAPAAAAAAAKGRRHRPTA